MKTFRTGDALLVPQEFAIYFHELDTFVQVENQARGPVIRATTDRFSSEAKERVVRYLATEGLVAERYRWWPGQGEVSWVMDNSWVRFRHHRQRLVTRVWAFLSWGRLLSLGLFLAALMIASWLKGH
jgi:hypothetical protein